MNTCVECGSDTEDFEHEGLPHLCEVCASSIIENAEGELWDGPTMSKLQSILIESRLRSPNDFYERITSNEEVRVLKKGEFVQDFDPIANEHLGYRYLPGFYKRNNSVVVWNPNSDVENGSFAPTDPYIVCSKDFALRVILLGYLP